MQRYYCIRQYKDDIEQVVSVRIAMSYGMWEEAKTRIFCMNKIRVVHLMVN